MAPTPLPESHYFPSVGKCLEGDGSLISWKYAFRALSNSSPVPSGSAQPHPDAALVSFLSDPTTTELLVRPFEPCPSPTAQTKSAFGTRTAAVNVTPTSQSSYDISEIKEDALWLSKEAQIDEVSALRAALLEWQSRPSTRLLSGFSEEETATLHDTAPGSSLASSLLLPSSSAQLALAKASTSNPNSFDSAANRRTTLLRQHFSDRRYILKVSEWLTRDGLSDDANEADVSAERNVRGTTWMSDIGKTILKIRASSKSAGTFIVECIEALQVRVNQLEEGNKGPGSDGRPEMEAEWGTNLIVEMIHILQLLFLAVDAPNELCSKSTFLSWLRFMHKYAFFDRFSPPHESQQALIPPLRSLVAIISLALLKFPLSLDHFFESTDGRSSRTGADTPFIADPSIFTEVNEIFFTAANASLLTAGPAAFGWSIILQTMRDYTQAKQEARDLRRSQKAVEGSGEADSSETEGGESSATESGTTPEPRRRAANRGTSQEFSIYDDVMENLMDHATDEDPIEYLAKSVLIGSQLFDTVSSIATGLCNLSGPFFDGHADIELRMRMVLLELIRSSLDMVEYSPDVIAASLAVITGGESYWSFAERANALAATRPSRAPTYDIASVFLVDDVQLVPQLLNRAYERFPYESLPFLKLMRALSTSCPVNEGRPSPVVVMLEHLTSFTQVLPRGFDAYETTREEENSNQIILVADLELFQQPQSKPLLMHSGRESSRALVLLSDNDAGSSVIIPEGTRGRVVSEDQPFAVQWDHVYSGLKYLGNLLQGYLPGSIVVDSATGLPPDREVVIEIVGLLTNLLTVSTTEQAKQILDDASGGLDGNRDVIAVVFEILESELQQDQPQLAATESIELLVGCIQFVSAMVKVSPAKVWPFLARSSLLEIESQGGKLASIVAGVEMVTGHFDFLIGSIKVFEALVDDAINNAVSRKVSGRKRPGRFAGPEEHSAVVPDKVIKKVLLAYGQTMVDVLESSPNWRFAVPEERGEVTRGIISVFDTILGHSYGVDDSADLTKKVTGALASVSTYIADVFLNTSTNPSIRPVLRVFYEGVEMPDTTLFIGTLTSTTRLVRKALNFSSTLIRLGSILTLPPSHLHSQLLRATPLIARLYAAHETFRRPVVGLLESITIAAAASTDQPPPLLGYLGSDSAMSFLVVLSQLDRLQSDKALQRSIWSLLSSVVSGRQQWLAIYLLTGRTPRDSLKEAKEKTPRQTSRAKPLFIVALDSISDLGSMSHVNALAILEFIALANDHWPWAISQIQSHPTFLKLISDYVARLVKDKQVKELANSVETAVKLRLASLIAEILAMYIHHTRQSGDTSFARKLLPHLTFYVDAAVKVPGYNISLHSNLRRNLEERFPACKLSSFKKTKLQRRDFGPDYFYDMELARRTLSFDRGWLGVKEDGLSREFERANVNLSVVEAQVLLLHSWKTLTVELCGSLLPLEPQFQTMMASVVDDCLVSNATSNLPETIFNQLVQVRGDFAFFLMQQLAEAKSTQPAVKSILKRAWDTIRSSGIDFELALSGGDASYYRSMLKILFLALRAHLDDPSLPNPAKSTAGRPTPQQRQQKAASQQTHEMVLSIIDLVVARGFRHLAAAVHDQPSAASPEDIALIIAILQTSLHIPGIEPYHQQISSLIADHGTARTATTLFSWSDQLAIDGDPIYGELSILLLVELSSVPSLAEHLAHDGVFNQLNPAKLMGYFRRGVRPLDPSASAQRLYTIWTRGVLPLCLNLIAVIGAPLAAEVSSFLNQYSAQLAIAASNFDTNLAASTAKNPSAAACITLSIASETHSLALLYRILDGIRAAGVSSGVLPGEVPELQWDARTVKEDVEVLLQGRRALRGRILPVGEAEREMVRMKPKREAAGAENRLEERVVAELDKIRELLSPLGPQ